MKTRSLAVFVALSLFVLLSYTTAKAQEDSTGRSKADVQKSIPKPTVVITDNLQTATEKTKGAEDSVKPAKSTKTFGSNAVEISEAPKGQSFENGKWYTVTTWDGSKWVPKRVWFANKPNEK